MKKKDKIITIIICCVIFVFLMISQFTRKTLENPKNVYQVYLHGEKMGLINDADELYDLINEEQKDIKEKYNVDNVYPPLGFEVVSYTTYDNDITNAAAIYDKIKNEDDFTIEGYEITIRSDDETKEDTVIRVLDEEVFKNALRNVVISFVSEEEFEKYINNAQSQIKDTGKIIEHMYFEEHISIKKTYISANEKIYTDEKELAQYLLFGDETEKKVYKVKEGDTIESISEDNELNPQEFLIANPKFPNEKSLLALNEEVNVALINPQLTLIEELHVVEDVEAVLKKETKYDNSKPSEYSEVTQPGVTGVTRFTQKVRVVNGKQDQGVEVVSKETIREPVTEITTRGRRYTYVTGTFVDTGGTWAWPTNSPYIITSEYAYRGGSLHTALDISGTGYGSPIYSANNGTVVKVATHYSLGKYIVIAHENNYYTMYAHLSAQRVSPGQSVSRGQVIGLMGSTGNSTGTHLHFSVSTGMPYEGGSFFNPWMLYR